MPTIQATALLLALTSGALAHWDGPFDPSFQPFQPGYTYGDSQKCDFIRNMFQLTFDLKAHTLKITAFLVLRCNLFTNLRKLLQDLL